MNMDRAKQVTYCLLRVVAGLLFFQAGGMKLFAWFGEIPPEMGGQPPLMSQIGIGGALEFFGGLAIMLGLLTRPIQNHGEPAVCSVASSCSSRRTVLGRGASTRGLEGNARHPLAPE